MSSISMPVPKNANDVVRWEHTRLRRRMLTGQWASDLKERLHTSLGATKAKVVRDVDLSSNAFASYCAAQSNNYNENPDITNTVDPQAAGLMTLLLAEAGYTSIMQNLQRMTLGLREMILAVNVVESDDGTLPVEVILRPVYPDVVVATGKALRSWELESISEVCEVYTDEGDKWVWREASANPSKPYLRAIDAATGEDVSQEVVGGIFAGDSFPFKTQSGTPVLPYVIYHAEVTSNMWNYLEWSELVEGTLEGGVDRSAYHYSLRNAAWSQRYMINCNLASSENAGQSHVVADPSTVLVLEASGDQQPSVGQWEQPFSPTEMQAAISEFERNLLTNAGIPGSDLVRGSGDPRSGYALAISTENKKASSRKSEPAFKRSDIKLFETIAVMVNSIVGSQLLPERGWGISYRAQSMSEAELTERQDRILKQVSAGLISKIEARKLLYGETTEQATEAIKSITEDTNV